MAPLRAVPASSAAAVAADLRDRRDRTASISFKCAMGAQKEDKAPPQQGGGPSPPAPAQQPRRAAVGWGEGAPELLHISAVRPTAEKVDRVELHPVQPWLAYVDRNSNVSVWNYESDEVRGAGLFLPPPTARPLPALCWRHRRLGLQPDV